MTTGPDTLDTLHARFLAVAEQHPDRPAVSDAAGTTSYRELAEQSRAITARLAGHCGPGELVALRAGRSRHALAGILGILGTGAGYLPVDPAYPRSRQDHLLQDSGTRLVLSDGDPLPGEVPLAPAGAVALPGGFAAALRPGAHPVAVPEGTAYSIYTSGSTGVPKGCLVGHRHVLALLDATLPLYGTGPDDVWSLFHSWSFDFSVWEIWGALLGGGHAQVVDRAAAADPRAFGELLRSTGTTVLSSVPSAFGQVAADAAGSGLRLPALRYVVFGGEPVVPEDVRRWWQAGIAPGAELVNMYGITETTVHVTHCPLTPETLERSASGRTPIGVPLPHLRVSLHDQDGRPVPCGTPGEMWVSGAGVCDGYLGRPDLTAERFVLGPDGVRHYRSGDWAVADEAGRLWYAGRKDGQVKLRGFRIELGEIEAALRSAPDVTAAGCLLEAGPDGRPRTLTACVVAHPRPASAAGLRRHLADRLPVHMLPQRIRFVDRLPLTPHGKLDRQALASRPAGG